MISWWCLIYNSANERFTNRCKCVRSKPHTCHIGMLRVFFRVSSIVSCHRIKVKMIFARELGDTARDIAHTHTHTHSVGHRCTGHTFTHPDQTIVCVTVSPEIVCLCAQNICTTCSASWRRVRSLTETILNVTMSECDMLTDSLCDECNHQIVIYLLG